MTEIIVKTQAELDAALARDDIDDDTHKIIIDSPAGVWITIGDDHGQAASPTLTDTDDVRRLRRDLAKVRDWVNRRGVYAGDEDSEWWDGYRQAEREVMLSAHELIDSLEAFDE